MPMLVTALAGSASYVMKRLWTNLALRSSFWLMATLFLQTIMTVRNGCSVPPAKRHIILFVLPLKLNNRFMPKDGLSLALLMSAKEKEFKRVTPPIDYPRSIKRVTKRVILTGLLFGRKMAKVKFSKKGKGGKTLQTPEQKRKAMSHEGQRNQQWEEKQMDKAQRLWDENKNKEAKDRLSMRAIAFLCELPKTTVIERLSGRRKGAGHIAGGKRQPRVLSTGKRVSNRVIKRVKF